MDIISYILSRKYTDMSIVGLGSIKGANCTIKDIVHQDGVNTVTFEWTGTDGTTKTREMSVYDGTPIYVWESGNTYHYGDLAIYESQFYRCIVENSDVTFDDTKWNEIGSPDGNYDIVQSKTLLPARFTAADRKLYFVIDECIFYLWDGYQWIALNHAVQVDSFPVASEKYLGKIYQYIGTTTSGYTHGYFYQCVSDGATPPVYTWEYVQTSDIQIATIQKAGIVKPDGETIDIDGNGVISVINRIFTGTQEEWDELAPEVQVLYKILHITDDEEIIDLGVYLRKVKIMPNAEDYPSEVVMYVGDTDANYTRGYNYRSTPTVTSGVTTYHWEQIDKVNPDEAQKITGRYNVLGYGLVNDGTTDNTIALRNMLNTIPAGATVYFPSGIYNISDTITLSKSLNFIGDTQTVRRGNLGSTISYVGNNTNIALFERDGVHQPQIGMAHLKFVGNAFEIVDNTDPFTTLPYPIFKEHEIITGISCLKFGPDLEGNNDISDCVFNGFSGCAVITSQNKFVKDCSFENCKLGITVTFDGMVQNCWFNKCGTAIEIVEDSIHSVGSVNISDCWADALSQHFLTSLCNTVINVTMDNCWVGMVDKSAIYFTGKLGQSHIQATFDRIAMMYAGIEDSARNSSIAMDTDCIYASEIRDVVFDITLGDTTIKRNNVEYPCISRYLFSASQYGMSKIIFISPNISVDKIFDATANIVYGLQAICKDGVFYNNAGVTFINGATSYSGSPIGHINAGAIGYFCFDTVNKVMYRATGTSKNDWEVINPDPTTDIDFTTVLGGE